MSLLWRKDIYGKKKPGLVFSLGIAAIVLLGVLYVARDKRTALEKREEKVGAQQNGVKVDVVEMAKAATGFTEVHDANKTKTSLEENQRGGTTEQSAGTDGTKATTEEKTAPSDPDSAPANASPGTLTDDNPVALALSGPSQGGQNVEKDERKHTRKGSSQSHNSSGQGAGGDDDQVADNDDGGTAPASAPNDGYTGETEATSHSDTRTDQKLMQVDSKKLVVFRRDKKVEKTVAPVVKNGFETNNFLPRGQKIPVYLLSKIETSQMESMVIFGVAENVKFLGKIMLPFGTRIFGASAKDAIRNRVAVTVDTIVYPDGKELPVSGIVMGIDEAPGIPGYFVPSPVWAQALPFAEHFLVAWDQAIQQQQQSALSQVTSAAISAVAPSFSPKVGAINAASDAMQTFITKQQEQIDREYQDYLVAVPGTPAIVQLRSALDLNKAKINGASENKMPVLPGFGNNPINPNGTVSAAVLKDEAANAASAITSASRALTGNAPTPSASATTDASTATASATPSAVGSPSDLLNQK